MWPVCDGWNVCRHDVRPLLRLLVPKSQYALFKYRQGILHIVLKCNNLQLLALLSAIIRRNRNYLCSLLMKCYCSVMCWIWTNLLLWNCCWLASNRKQIFLDRQEVGCSIHVQRPFGYLCFFHFVSRNFTFIHWIPSQKSSQKFWEAIVYMHCEYVKFFV